MYYISLQLILAKLGVLGILVILAKDSPYLLVKGWIPCLLPGAREEVESVDLNDKPLNQRLAQILSDLGERPTASIPAACGGHNETTVAYRFFDNDKVTYDKIL